MAMYNIKVKNKKDMSFRDKGRIKTFKKGKTYSFKRNLTPKEVSRARGMNNKTTKVLSIKLARKKK